MYSLFNGQYDRGFWCGRPTYSGESLSYWERSLFQRLTAMFKWEGLPTPSNTQIRWDKDAFLYGLFRLGYLPCFRSNRYGIVFQPGTPAGIGLFYQPTGMTINTPYFQFGRPLIIGIECEVLKLTPDYRGIWDIVSKYAQEMQYLDVAIRQSSLNARFAYAIAAKNKQSADSAKAMMERLANGETAIVYDTNMSKDIETGEMHVPWQQFDRDLKQNFILPELVEVRRMLLTDFYKEIGVKIAPEKKERQIVSEQAASDSETFNRREVWNQVLQESVDRYNKFFDQNLKVTYNEPEQEVMDDVATAKQDSRSVQLNR